MTSHPTEPKLPESLEVVAYRDRHDHCDLYLSAGNSGDREPLVRLTDHESALKARDAEIERLRGALSQIANLDPGAPIVRGSDEWYATVANAAKMIAIDQARATGGEKAQ